MLGYKGSDRGGFLASGTGAASGVGGAAIDLRATTPSFALMSFVTPGESAVFTLQASLAISQGWFNHSTYTATTTSATAAMSAFLPFVRVIPNAIYSGGAGTGFPVVFYQPGSF